jgi:hypothetical protein
MRFGQSRCLLFPTRLKIEVGKIYQSLLHYCDMHLSLFVVQGSWFAQDICIALTGNKRPCGAADQTYWMRKPFILSAIQKKTYHCLIYQLSTYFQVIIGSGHLKHCIGHDRKLLIVGGIPSYRDKPELCPIFLPTISILTTNTSN